MTEHQSIINIPELFGFLTTTLKMLKESQKEIEKALKKFDPKLLESEPELLADSSGGESTLSDTQSKILECYRSGLVRRKDIAKRLGMNPHTLDVQVVRLRVKLGLKSIHELVVYTTGPKR